MEEFRFRRPLDPSELVPPKNIPEIDLKTARKECTSAAEQLGERTSGFGELPAKRYLLRYEYGFSATKLANVFDVSLSTISKQTTGMRDEILKFPTLARIVGQFRATRTGLERPDIPETRLFDSNVEVNGDEIDAIVMYRDGGPDRPYSWKYRLKTELKEGDIVRHLLIDYIIDSEYGVLLKRRLKGISHTSWSREPCYQDKRQYLVYALPHTEIPNKDGTLIETVQHHGKYDMYLAYNMTPWDSVESKLNDQHQKENHSAEYSEEDNLLDRLRYNFSTEPIRDYCQEKHLRDNLEHILRVYPRDDHYQIPSETIDLLWNGSLEKDSANNQLSKALDTSSVHRVA